MRSTSWLDIALGAQRMSGTSSQPIILHGTPRLDPLPFSDVESLYHLVVLQLACPRKYTTKTGDWGVNGGKLPYVTHLGHQININHLKSIPGYNDIDSELSPEEKGENLSWVAYIEGQLSDLVNHNLYSLPPNYPQTIGKAHAQNLSFPQSTYIPQRLRSLYKGRLQHVGLWGLGGFNEGDLVEEDRRKLEQTYVHAPGGTVAPRAWSGWNAGKEFEARRRKKSEEELVERIKGVLAPLERRVGEKLFFFGQKPSTADCALFAHLALILEPEFSNPLYPNLVKEGFPNLVSHYGRMSDRLFGSAPSSSTTEGVWSRVPFITENQPASSLWDSINPLSWFARDPSPSKPPSKELDSRIQREKALRRGRWLWYLGSAGVMVAYLFASGLVSVDTEGLAVTVLGEDDEDEEVVYVEDDDEED